MFYLPTFRRLLLPAILLLGLIVTYKSLPLPTSLPSLVLHPGPAPPRGVRVPKSVLQKPLPFANASSNYLAPPNHYFYTYDQARRTTNQSASSVWQPALDPKLAPLYACAKTANKYTGHLRLPNIIQNISAIAPDLDKVESRVFWNPTIISLPYWSQNPYLIVSRIVTDGNHQENVLCEADVCFVGSDGNPKPGDRPCTQDDLKHLGSAGGMRCVHPPVTLSVPPTPADKCEGKFESYVDIPGFHDPRLFWSGRGEPLMMVNTQSRYACFGLWLIDLRSLFPPLQRLLCSSPDFPSLGPLKSYPTLTEITRNPPDTRAAIEKNWLLFFPSSGESYVHYDFLSSYGTSPGRTFAKLLGNGLTTTNLTDPLESACLNDISETRENDQASSGGTWHQATNSLRLVLCNRSDPACKVKSENTVFFALVHRKFANYLKLPLRYERFFVVWASTPPFTMLAASRYPILMANETASGWTASQNWDDEPDNAATVANTKFHNINATEPYGGKDFWAYFTYTVSMSYAFGRAPRSKSSAGDQAADMHVGYLDDEVLLGIGADDAGQTFARVKAEDLVQCMRACPGRKIKHD